MVPSPLGDSSLPVQIWTTRPMTKIVNDVNHDCPRDFTAETLALSNNGD